MPSQKEMAARIRDFQDALFGEGPASSRIEWRAISDTDASSRKAEQFLRNLNIEYVLHYAVSKYTSTTQRGVVIFDIDAPSGVGNHSVDQNFGAMIWIPYTKVQQTKDVRFQEAIQDSDPRNSVNIALYQLKPDRKSLLLWSVTASIGGEGSPLGPQAKAAVEACYEENEEQQRRDGWYDIVT